jgi:hypothetical protein
MGGRRLAGIETEILWVLLHINGETRIVAGGLSGAGSRMLDHDRSQGRVHLSLLPPSAKCGSSLAAGSGHDSPLSQTRILATEADSSLWLLISPPPLSYSPIGLR